MKKHRSTRPTPKRRLRNPSRPTHRPDPLQPKATPRLLYTDFLALCFYPGMEHRRCA